MWVLGMGGNLVLIGFCRTNTLRTVRMRRTYFAVLEDEDVAAPVDLVAGKTGEPNPESNEIAQWEQPQVAANGFVMHHAFADLERNGHAKDGGSGQRSPRPPA